MVTVTQLKAFKRFNNWRFALCLLATPTWLLVLASGAPKAWTPLASHLPSQTTPSPTPVATRTESASLPQPQPQAKKASAPTQVRPPLDVEMKVAIAKDVSTVPVATSTPGIIKDDSGRSLRRLPSGVAFYPQAAGNHIHFGNWKSPNSIWIEASKGGVVGVGQHWYRGRVRLISQNTSLLAVNHVNLEPYLYSVVGSEMLSSWPLEALKAQAVAARSYALARKTSPPSPFYDIGATEAWQVYKGLDGEANTTQAAVHATSGLFLSYQNAVVDALYADTEATTQRAHGGRGMSQTGARDLAKQGQDYLHILGTYYPGAGITRLQLYR